MLKNKKLLVLFLSIIFSLGFLGVYYFFIKTAESLGSKPTPLLNVSSSLSNNDLYTCLKNKDSLILKDFEINKLHYRIASKKDSLIYLNLNSFDTFIVEIRLYNSIYTSIQSVWNYENVNQTSLKHKYVSELNNEIILSIEKNVNEIFSDCEP